MTGEMAIEARGLTKRFGKTVALEDVDLSIPRGSAFGLLGPAGSGKSTIVRLLSGLARPTAGALTVDGVPGGSLAARRHLGVLLQDTQLPGWMTGREALAFAAALGGVPSAGIPGRIDDVAKRFRIDEVLDRRVSALAAPVRGRLAIAQALAGDPGILLLDEPFHWLDPEGRAEVLAILRDLRGSKTIVLAAHRPADVEALCDRVATLEAGRVLRSSKVEVRSPKPARAHEAGTSATPGTRAAARPSLGDAIAELIYEVLRLLRDARR